MGIFRGFKDRIAYGRHPHQGKREKARRLRQVATGHMGPIARTDTVPAHDAVPEGFISSIRRFLGR